VARGADEVIPDWERRFRAPTVGFPEWARHRPDRLVFTSNESGINQLYAWDRARGSRRRMTAEPLGVSAATIALDGETIVWFRDVTGDEVGQWLSAPFDAQRDSAPLVHGVPDAWSAGLAVGDDVVVLGTADDSGFAVFAAHPGEEASVMHRHDEVVHVADLSHDGAFVCLAHAERGDAMHLALRILAVRTSERVADLWDGTGLGLTPGPWSPRLGDQRLAIVHEREGFERPAIWWPLTGERHDLHLDLPGDVAVAAWWPDGDGLLLVHSHGGRDELLRFDLPSETLGRIDHPPGSVSGAAVRPDGSVWFRMADGATPAMIRDDDGREVLAAEGDRAPSGQPFRSWAFPGPANDRVHGFVAVPPGPGPFPVVMQVHGGPTWADRDDFRPDVQAWVDHGFAVGLVNYRGSTGYGVRWRDMLLGDPGFPEIGDVVAGLRALVDEGVADSSRAVLSGRSWGGYITLLGIGLHPELWSAAVAVVPVADYITAYRDEAPELQAFDRTLFGGSPIEVPELFAERSPLTYVDRVQTPVLIIAGDNDSRCPIDQILSYVERLAARGVPHEVYRYDAGHGSLVTEERVKQMRAELEFVLRHVSV
jgi:dipeptidyl aminopeptidase/acylaminoacyl peptidase